MRKKGFYKETTYQLILIFITLVFLGILVGSIFSGINLQNALCKAIPWLCGERQDVDYEISLKSTQNAICAVGSAFLKRQWDGGLDCNWGEPETDETGGSEGTGRITGFAGSEEEDKELEISEARKLPSSFYCDTDETGKYTCTVKNFIMPQETTDWEEWIAYWGDPHYLTYWSSFPAEEDTWNFEVKIWHHVVIGALALIPPGRGAALGFKTIMTIFRRGPARTMLGKEAAKLMVEEGSEKALKNAAFSAFVRRKISAQTKDAIIDASTKVGTEITEKEAEALAKNVFSKLPKKELKMFLEDLGKKRGIAWGFKELARRDLIKTLGSRFEKIAAKKGIWAKIKQTGKQTVILGGKVVALEAALAALADSTMEKYKPIGNAVAIKNPGNESEDLVKYELPEEMEGKPVMMKWIATGDEFKHAHFVSPCYLKEFNVNMVEEMKCHEYMYNKTGKQTTCNNEDAEIDGHDAPLECGKLEDNINTINDKTTQRMYEKIRTYMKMKDKKLFEFGNDWNLTKIYLPWFLTDDENSPRYAITNIVFIPGEYEVPVWTGEYRKEAYTGGDYVKVYKDVEKPSEEPVVDGDFNFLMRTQAVFKDVYEANIIEGSKEMGLSPIDLEYKKNDNIMEKGKEYLLHMVNIGGDDVVLDVYDISECTNIMDLSPYDYEQFSCEEVKTLKPDLTMDPVFPTVEEEKADQIGRIKSTINYLMYNGGEYTLKITDVADNILVGDIDNVKAIRAIEKIKVTIICDKLPWGKDMDLTLEAVHTFKEQCEIVSPQLNKYFKSEIKFPRDLVFSLTDNKIENIVYGGMYFESEDEVFIIFYDMDESGDWEEISIARKISFLDKINPLNWFGKSKESFTITISGIKENGDYEKIFMTNCKVDSIIISFKNDEIKDARLDVEGPNYCVRYASPTSRAIKKIAIWGATVLAVAASILGDGFTAPFVIGGTILVVGGPLQEEIQLIWPK